MIDAYTFMTISSRMMPYPSLEGDDEYEEPYCLQPSGFNHIEAGVIELIDLKERIQRYNLKENILMAKKPDPPPVRSPLHLPPFGDEEASEILQCQIDAENRAFSEHRKRTREIEKVRKKIEHLEQQNMLLRKDMVQLRERSAELWKGSYI